MGVVPVPPLPDPLLGGVVVPDPLPEPDDGAVTVNVSGFEVSPSLVLVKVTFVAPALRPVGTVTTALVLDQLLTLAGMATPLWVKSTLP